MAGAWIMTEDSEWELNEPYKSELALIKTNAMHAWVESVVGHLVETTGYDGQYLYDKFTERVHKQMSPTEIVDSFVIEAMEGEL